jgi:hypothetical protein
LSQTYSIAGKVINEENTPLKTVEVIITNHTDTAKSTTDKEGNFAIENITPGFYNITISTHGYENFADTIDISKAPLGVGALQGV